MMEEKKPEQKDTSATAQRKKAASAHPQKIRIGITGSMGSGKSTAGKIISRYIPFNDCDRINSDLLQPGHRGWKALEKAGLLIADDKGGLDRKAIADRMFTDPKHRKKIEGILQPMILEEMEAWLDGQDGLCAVEVPLLFECSLQDRFDQVWTVLCPYEKALERLELGRHIPPEQAKARLAVQYSPQKKAELSSAILYNDDTLENLENQIRILLEKNGLDLDRLPALANKPGSLPE